MSVIPSTVDLALPRDNLSLILRLVSVQLIVQSSANIGPSNTRPGHSLTFIGLLHFDGFGVATHDCLWSSRRWVNYG